MVKTQKMSTQTLVMGAVLTALVVILQIIGCNFLRFTTFSFNLVLIPIVIGTATCGKSVGAWLGFVSAIVILATGDATLFLSLNAPKTLFIVFLKGIACGYLAGLAYQKSIKIFKGNEVISTFISAIVCPIVNTGIFALGCFTLLSNEISTELAGGAPLGSFVIFTLIGINFIIEIVLNIVLAPAVTRIIKAVK